MVGRWFTTKSATTKTNKRGACSAKKYEKEPKHVRAKARRMSALKAKQCMKAMKTKAIQCKKTMKAKAMKAKAVIDLRGQPTIAASGKRPSRPSTVIDLREHKDRSSAATIIDVRSYISELVVGYLHHIDGTKKKQPARV